MKRLLSIFIFCITLILPFTALAGVYGTAVYGTSVYGAAGDNVDVLGLGNTYKYNLVLAGSTLRVPEGATGCTIHDNTIRGTLDLDETVTIENTFVTTVDLSGIEDTGGVETATFNDCAFVQSEAAIDATLGANGLTSYNAGCQFEVTVTDCFKDYVGNDFHLTRGSPLKNAGGDTGADVDLDGRATPSGSAHDIGCYELRRMNSSVGMGLGTMGHNPYRWDD